MGKNEQNTQQKLVPDHYLILLLTRNIVNERSCQKSPKNVISFLFLNPTTFQE